MKNVVVTSVPTEGVIRSIKAVRLATALVPAGSLGLKDAKDAVDLVRHEGRPAVIATGVSEDVAAGIVGALGALGVSAVVADPTYTVELTEAELIALRDHAWGNDNTLDRIGDKLDDVIHGHSTPLPF